MQKDHGAGHGRNYNAGQQGHRYRPLHEQAARRELLVMGSCRKGTLMKYIRVCSRKGGFIPIQSSVEMCCHPLKVQRMGPGLLADPTSGFDWCQP